jgi:integrase/recombinase XerD
VTRDEVNAYLDHLQDSGLAPSTVSLRWRNLRPFFAWWANETDRPNPFDGTDQPRAAPPPPDVLAPEDVRALLATCGGRSFEDRRDRAVILTLLDTGAR